MDTHQQMIDSAKGGDGASLGEENPSLVPRLRRIQQFYEEYNRVTHEVLGAASKQESEGLMQWVKSAKAREEDIIDLEKHKETYEQMLRSGEKLRDDFMKQLNAARNKQPVPLLSRGSYEDWDMRFRKAYYKEKESFVSSKLPEFIRSWEALLLKRAELLKNPEVKVLTTRELRELEDFTNDKKFGELSNKKRIGLVASVQAALLAKNRNMPQLFAQAKSMLEAAARQQALSWDKVGVWLERIFKSGAKTELIDQFINGSGAAIAGKKMTLTELIENWTKASNHFHDIEDKRKKHGTPRSFHFVGMDVFLNWSYEQRTSYLQEAEYRLNRPSGEEIFYQIRHELDAGDWESAEYFLTQAKMQTLSPEDQKQLQSMHNFLKAHRTKDQEQSKKRPPEEISAELHSTIEDGVHESEKVTYHDLCKMGADEAWRWMTIKYNRKWCHDHNFYDSRKEQVMEQEAKDPTRERLRTGHKKRGIEVNVVKDDTGRKEAVRDQSGLRAAQILFYNGRDEASRQSIMEEVRRQTGRDFWYWTSLIPEGVPYSEDLHTITTVHPKIKKLTRELQAQGATYEPPAHAEQKESDKQTTVRSPAKPLHTNTAAEVQHVMAS